MKNTNYRIFYPLFKEMKYGADLINLENMIERIYKNIKKVKIL